MEALQRLGLKATPWAQAQVDTLRRKPLKIGAIVRVSVRRVWLQLSSAYPWKDIFTRAFYAPCAVEGSHSTPTIAALELLEHHLA